MTSFMNTLFRDIGLNVNLHKRIPMVFDIKGIDKRPWVPPLFMLINPRTFEKSSAKIVTTTKTRSGWVEYHWGDELDTLSASAATASFMLPYAGLASGSSKPFINRTSTIGYMNFLSIIEIYRSNGLLWDENGVPVRAGSLRVLYDSGYHSGYFEDFIFREVEDTPYRFDVSFTFKVQNTMTVLSPGSPF